MKTDIVGEAGRQSQEDVLDGRYLPSFLAGVIPFSIGGHTYLVNPTSINTFQTASEVARSIEGTLANLPWGGTNPGIVDMLSPTGQLALAGAGAGGYKGSGGLKSIIDAFAPMAAMRRSGINFSPLGLSSTPSKTYPMATATRRWPRCSWVGWHPVRRTPRWAHPRKISPSSSTFWPTTTLYRTT